MNVVVDLHSGEAFDSFCACVFYVVGTTVWFYIIFRAPSWGSGVLSHVCIYVTGLIQAVLFYLRVVVLCSVGVECSGSV